MPYYAALLPQLGFRETRPRVWANGEQQVIDIQQRMRALGFAAPPIQHLDGATALFMRDPDGIRFEITHYPSDSAHDDRDASERPPPG